VVQGLRNDFRLVSPAGSFYAFPALPGGIRGEDLLAGAMAREVLLVPGSAFSEKNTHFRLSFAAPDEKLAEGLEILNELART